MCRLLVLTALLCTGCASSGNPQSPATWADQPADCPDLKAPDPSAKGISAIPEGEEPPVLIGGLGSLSRYLEYPDEAKKAGMDGTVVVQFVVNRQGRPLNLEITQSRGYTLDQASLDAVKKLRFEPGMREGVPICVHFQLPVRFRLN